MRYLNKVVFISLIIFLLSKNNSIGQSIPSYWMNVHNLENYFATKNGEVEKIILNTTEYYSSGKSYKSKWIYEFYEPQKCRGKFYKEGELKTHFSYELDRLNQLIKISKKSKVPLLGWEKMIIEYEYDGTRRIKEKHFKNKNELIRSAEYQYDLDSLNYLTKLSINNGYEIATYNYQNHSYVYRVYDGRSELVLEKTSFANMQNDQKIVNEHGDITRVIWPTSNPKNKVYHVMKYKYDKYGNWIKRIRYIEKNGKREVTSRIKRKIKYR